MALIKCKECGKEISTTAENCPYCGYRTAHGRSITEAKGLLIQWIICVALIVAGFILFFANVGAFGELMEGWKNRGHFAVGFGNFFAFVSYHGAEEMLWKFVLGVVFLIGGIVDLLSIKKNMESMKENGFELEKTAAGAPSADKVEQRIPAWKRVEMERDGVPLPEFPESPEEPRPVRKFCHHCGAKVTQEQTTCCTCGNRL